MTSGFHKQDLIILAARPSIGKTALALNIAQNASKSIGEPIMIFSLENECRETGYENGVCGGQY
ncbi:DnaB-like helicase C-terminal domain-containing protein [Brevibacillus brevis]|uniref:DnaB-like helicase C-terminal domain-containing protein n=1 Tax=Brevibacillus brevis TaxID=1393 RepID=UPI003D245CA6